jgi:hypothetical protein
MCPSFFFDSHYLWFKLRVLPASPASPALTAFQQAIADRGEHHFTLDGREPLKYFLVLLLSLQVFPPSVFQSLSFNISTKE